MEADVGDLDDVLELPGLFLDLGGEEERRGGDRVAVELGERVEHVEPLHVHDRRVDAQLGPETYKRGRGQFRGLSRHDSSESYKAKDILPLHSDRKQRLSHRAKAW